MDGYLLHGCRYFGFRPERQKFNYLRQMKTYPNAIITKAEEICCDSLTFSCLIAAKFLASLSRFLT